MSRTIGRLGTAGALGVLLVAAAPASAQRGELRFNGPPVIAGSAVVGQTLSVSGASFYSPRPADTVSEWRWWRCPDNNPSWRCESVARGPSTYRLTEADRGRWIAASRSIRLGRSSAFTMSRAVGPVAAAPAPTPTPTPTPAPTASPTPVPPPEPFTVPAPVATQGEILDQAAINRAIRPFPVVRMRGQLTLNGARVTLLSVKAPRKAKVSVRCTGPCPQRRWAPKTRKKQLTRVRAFERSLRAGAKITISITRKGLIGKRTTFVIRRGEVPKRYDRCLSPRGKVRRCPGA